MCLQKFKRCLRAALARSRILSMPACFHDIVTTNQFDVIALTETWLDSSISNHELPRGYVVHRRDRQDKLGGGVLLAINDTIKTDHLTLHLSLLNW